ncbi:response regulator transcription factor, partial [Marinospirillum sp.]|uniref:response regulator transcription factor n=1 Tax=Marinospirillum sp. TaxID=2183934 RepID=UPI0028705085
MMNDTSPTIAIIEDNHDLREELVFFLQQKGYPTWGVASAEGFWKQLHQQPAKIVLLDLGLPGEDGLSVLKYLSSLSGFAVIVITAHGEREVHQQALQYGADLYLVKPVSFSHLASSIEALWFKMQNSVEQKLAVQKSGRWQVNSLERQLVSPDGRPLKLSQHELTLINILNSKPNEILTREALVELMFPHQ